MDNNDPEPSVSDEFTGLPDILIPDLCEKFDRILANPENVAKEPGSSLRFLIESKHTPNKITMISVNGESDLRKTCDCLNWDLYKVCAHAAAVSVNNNCVKSYAEWQ